MDRRPSDEDRAYERRLDAEIDAALAALPDREARVLRLYFGLLDHPPMTLSEVAALLGMTSERARQLKDSGLDRLRGGPDGGAGIAALLPPDPTTPLDGAAELHPPQDAA